MRVVTLRGDLITNLVSAKSFLALSQLLLEVGFERSNVSRDLNTVAQIGTQRTLQSCTSWSCVDTLCYWDHYLRRNRLC